MPYFFASREGDTVTITGDDARHLARSLRSRPGETIQVVDPAGRLLRVRLDQVTPEKVAGRVLEEAEHRPEPGLEVTLALATLPAAALEPALSRGTELGAAAFLLVQAERSVARGGRPERWAAICREAAMLAGRLRVPAVSGPVPLPEAIARASNPILLHRSAPARLAAEKAAGPATLFIGPEGGWTEAELGLAGGRIRSLGPRNLRAETAALAALAVMLAGAGDL